ncbi:MAG: helix-turn-helix transcriptional regulator [Proteobacteria bacterium]|nr:helix-turn-helix transcriptional regulator [Pseudomonadota bacterium]
MSDNVRNDLSDDAGAQASVFAALGDETRLLLVAKLAHRSPQSITQLTTGSKLTRQAISRHLRVLEDVGVVGSARRGRESLFAYRPEPICGIAAYLDLVAKQWDQSLARLKSIVEA